MHIALDAGHGPNTPGKRAPDGSLREFDFNRTVAAYARALLERQGHRVSYCHAAHTDVPLRERAARANQLGAAVFISIHANFGAGATWSDACGIETFHAPQASAAARRLAQALQHALVARTARRSRGVREAPFYVLRATRMPAVLVECGFMSHRAECALLKEDGYRRACARAIAEGLAVWMASEVS